MDMRNTIAGTVFAIAIFGYAVASGAQTLVPRDCHPWGGFEEGAWKRVRVIRETLDPEGVVVDTSVIETTTTLIAVDDDGVTLRIESVIEVAGRRWDVDPRILRQGFNGESDGQTAEYRDLGDETVTIDGQDIPINVRQVTLRSDEGERVSTVYFSENVDPFLLRQLSTDTPANADHPGSETTTEVVAIDMPYQVLAESLPTSHVKTTHTNGNGSTVTIEVHCFETPGGVVAHTSKDLNPSGDVVRRSTLELVDYGFDLPEDRPRRGRRYRRNRPRGGIH